MCARLVTAEEALVDPVLGYPAGFAKLCRNAHKQMRGLITPYTDGPPQCYLPYAPRDDEDAKVKEFDGLFRNVPEEMRDPPNARKFADQLWKQLDHLGNAGFDPAKFRVDMYGNVVYYHADPGSPLFWEVDHWFPHSRGGKTVVSNLRIVQWQVNQRKTDKLEFLVPWWDLQLGVSVNQFLSAFASKNAEFRRRFFSYLFLQGEKEQLSGSTDVASQTWPTAFRDRKSQMGLAPASLAKDANSSNKDADWKLITGPTAPSPATPGTSARRRWSVAEEEALRRALQKFGPGNWKEIKEFEPALVNRSTVQIKDKYRLMKGDWNVDKENCTARESVVASALQKEMQMKVLREEEKRAKHIDIARMEQNLKDIREENTKEELTLQAMEDLFRDHRDALEKQRRWAETQSLYKQSLERMIRDSLHQSTAYKEQARLNQAACNVLIAKLETVNSACKASEEELLIGFKQREGLQEVGERAPSPVKGADLVDVSSCLSQPFDIHHLKQESGDKQVSISTKKYSGPQQVDMRRTSTEEKHRTLARDLAPELQVVVVGYEFERHSSAKENPELVNCDEQETSSDDMASRETSSPSSEDRDASPPETETPEAGQCHPDQCLSSGGNSPSVVEKPEEPQCWSPTTKSAEKPRGLIGGLLRRLNMKQQLNPRRYGMENEKRLGGGTPDSKEFVDLAVKMGEISLETANDTEVAADSANEAEKNTENGRESPERIAAEERMSTATSSFEDAVSGSPVSQTPKNSLLKSLHDDEADSKAEFSSRPSSFADHAGSGFKQSFKVCSLAWGKAMKKLEARIQDVHPH